MPRRKAAEQPEDDFTGEPDLDDSAEVDAEVDAELDEEDLELDEEDLELDEDVLVDDDTDEDESDGVVDLEEEEQHPDDVEHPLDVILEQQIASDVEDEDEDDEEDDEEDERAEGISRIPLRQPGEFVCRSCFLVKHPNQLADPKAMLCKDCV